MASGVCITLCVVSLAQSRRNQLRRSRQQTTRMEGEGADVSQHNSCEHSGRADKQRALRKDLLMTTPNPRRKITTALGALIIAFAAAMPLAGATENERFVPLTAAEQAVAFRNSAPVEVDPTTGPAQTRQFDADAGGPIVSALVADSADRLTLSMVVFFIWSKWKALLFEQRLRGACGESVPVRD